MKWVWKYFPKKFIGRVYAKGAKSLSVDAFVVSAVAEFGPVIDQKIKQGYTFLSEEGRLLVNWAHEKKTYCSTPQFWEGLKHFSAQKIFNKGNMKWFTQSNFEIFTDVVVIINWEFGAA